MGLLEPGSNSNSPYVAPVIMSRAFMVGRDDIPNRADFLATSSRSAMQLK